MAPTISYNMPPRRCREGCVNKIELSEEIQHGLDRATNERTRFLRKKRIRDLRELSPSELKKANDEFHIDVFERILEGHKQGKFSFLTEEDISAIRAIIEDLKRGL